MRSLIAGMCCAVVMAFAATTAPAQQPQAIAKEDVDYYKAIGAWVAELPAYLDKVTDAAQKTKYKERLSKLHEQYSALDDASKKYIRELDRLVASPNYSGNTILPPSDRAGLEKPRQAFVAAVEGSHNELGNLVTELKSDTANGGEALAAKIQGAVAARKNWVEVLSAAFASYGISRDDLDRIRSSGDSAAKALRKANADIGNLVKKLEKG
jgi:hypothetical protein